VVGHDADFDDGSNISELPRQTFEAVQFKLIYGE
jgi:hypothetical protein